MHDKTNTLTCAPSENSDQSANLRSLIGDFAVRMTLGMLIYP